MRNDAVVAVRPERAAPAPGFRIGRKHEVIDDQLIAARKQISKGFLARGPLKHIRLFNALPWQVAAFAAELVPQSLKVFFLGQKAAASVNPCVARDDLMVSHMHTPLRVPSFPAPSTAALLSLCRRCHGRAPLVD